jgi:hypothetical protein
VTDGHPLQRDADYPGIMAVGHRVTGTELYILELVMFGAAGSSYYLLLRSRSVLTRLDEEDIRNALVRTPARFGRHLVFGKDLVGDPAGGALRYVGPVRPPRTP